MTLATGRVKGKTITLDEALPSLEGKRVRVLVEDEESLEAVSPETNRQWWGDWVARGPQGPIDDEGEPDFP